MDSPDLERYSRQIMLPEIGPQGQERISSASVLVVGLGGLGAPVAAYLTAAGVGRLGLCDADTVSLSNLQRQILYAEDQIGMSKPMAARDRLAAMSHHTVFDIHSDGLTPECAAEVIGQYDLVVDCCDNFATRYLIDDTCAALGRVWIYGAIGAFGGQVAVFGCEGEDGRTVRYRDLYPDSESLAAVPAAHAGVVGPLPGIIGAIQASEALKLIAGYGSPLCGTLFAIDTLTLNTEKIQL